MVVTALERVLQQCSTKSHKVCLEVFRTLPSIIRDRPPHTLQNGLKFRVGNGTSQTAALELRSLGG